MLDRTTQFARLVTALWVARLGVAITLKALDVAAHSTPRAP